MSVLASCKKIREIVYWTMLSSHALWNLNILPNFDSLKILDLKGQQFPGMETSEMFEARGYLILRSAYCTDQVLGKPGPTREPCLQSPKPMEIKRREGRKERKKGRNDCENNEFIRSVMKLRTLRETVAVKGAERRLRVRAQALGSLRNLEELLLPTGDGIHQVAKLIIRQCLQLCCLQVLTFHHILDDDSVIELVPVARHTLTQLNTDSTVECGGMQSCDHFLLTLLLLLLATSV
ncbi:Baculoviral IAP repeat-containing protein 1e [Apodemus speciosus]|uniref:Baculoviral IAP repeat-containing protein 1e n=1 Tax=Apodemus speciosus TaxID=105296 RepID=A0ABQ0FGW8_APOSI